MPQIHVINPEDINDNNEVVFDEYKDPEEEKQSSFDFSSFPIISSFTSFYNNNKNTIDYYISGTTNTIKYIVPAIAITIGQVALLQLIQKWFPFIPESEIPTYEPVVSDPIIAEENFDNTQPPNLQDITLFSEELSGIPDE